MEAVFNEAALRVILMPSLDNVNDKIPCRIAQVRCTLVAYPVNTFAEIVSPVPNNVPLANK